MCIDMHNTVDFFNTSKYVNEYRYLTGIYVCLCVHKKKIESKLRLKQIGNLIYIDGATLCWFSILLMFTQVPQGSVFIVYTVWLLFPCDGLQCIYRKIRKASKHIN